MEREEVVLNSHTTRHGFLYAKLKTDRGEVHTICTHLAAVFTDIPYPDATGSCEEQAAQIDELIARLNEKGGTDGNVLVLGDIDTGPEGKNYSAEVGANYARFAPGNEPQERTHHGRQRAVHGCDTNPLVAPEVPPIVIDHIFVRGRTGSAERVLTSTVDVSVITPACGDTPETVTTACSDHHGLQATIDQEPATGGG